MIGKENQMEAFKKYRILIVDGESILRDRIVSDLKELGFSVFTARSGAKAIEVVRETRVHLVIADLCILGEMGLNPVEGRTANTAATPVIVLISGPEKTSEKEYSKEEARFVLQKPFDKKQLVSSIFNALGIPDESTHSELATSCSRRDGAPDDEG
jgi:DNA-binding NtrC family response regulator